MNDANDLENGTPVRVFTFDDDVPYKGIFRGMVPLTDALSKSGSDFSITQVAFLKSRAAAGEETEMFELNDEKVIYGFQCSWVSDEG